MEKSVKKNKVTPKDWEMAIRKCRGLVNNYDKARWVIAETALEVCDYSHGGRKGESIYSVRKFAEAIEMDRKTLYQWIRVYTLVYMKLPIKIREKINTYNYQDLEEVSDRVGPKSTPKEVRRHFDEVMKVPPESRKFAKYLLHLNSIFYNVSRPMIMKDVSEAHINLMIEKTNVINALLKKELEFREKYPNDKRADAKRLNIRDEVARRIAESP